MNKIVWYCQPYVICTRWNKWYMTYVVRTPPRGGHTICPTFGFLNSLFVHPNETMNPWKSKQGQVSTKNYETIGVGIFDHWLFTKSRCHISPHEKTRKLVGNTTKGQGRGCLDNSMFPPGGLITVRWSRLVKLTWLNYVLVSNKQRNTVSIKIYIMQATERENKQTKVLNRTAIVEINSFES